MTVAVNDTIERYVITGAGPYAYTWRIFADTDLQVTALSLAVPPVPTLLTYLTHYTVTGANDASGGTISLTAAALALYTGFTLDVRSNTPRAQTTSIRNIGRFLPEIHEDAYDNIDRQLQDLGRLVDASIRAPDNELPLPLILPPIATRASKFLVCNPDGTISVSAGTGGGDSALRTDLANAAAGVDGSRLSGYRRDANALARTVHDVVAKQLWLADYASEDGVTDDSVGWGKAVAAAVAQGGGTIIVAHDTVLKNVAWAAKVSIRCINGARLLTTATAAGDFAIVGAGTTGASSLLTANGVKGARQVTVTSAAAFAVGQYVTVRTNEFISAPDGRNQQITKIQSIVGTTITLRDELLDLYATANAAELVVTSPIYGVKFTDVVIVGANNGNGGGISLTTFADCDLGNLEVTGTSARAAVVLVTGTNLYVRGNIHDCLGGSVGSSIGLAFFIINVDHVHILPGTLLENVTESSFEYRSRWCTASFTARNLRDSAFNTHGNGNHHILFYNFTVDGSDSVGMALGFTGHLVGDSYIWFVNGFIGNTVSHSISSGGAAGKTNKHCLIDNVRCDSMLISGAGTVYAGSFAWCDDLTINDFYGDCTTRGTTDPAGTFNASNCTRLAYTGGAAKNAATGFGLQFSSCSAVKVNGVDMSGNANHVNTTGSSGTNFIVNNFADSSTNSIEATWNSWGNPWDSGVFTLTSTGITGTPADAAATWTVGPNNVVSVTSAGIPTGVSTAVTMTGTGLPARLWPSAQRRINAIYMTDNGADQLGRLTFETTGDITFAKDAFGAAFTAAGQKGWKRFCVSYPRN